MTSSLLPWFLRGRNRAEYEAFKHGRLDSRGLLSEAGSVGWLLLLIVAARLSFNALLRGPTQRLAQQRGSDEHHRDGRRLLEECWVALGNVVMLAASAYTVLYRNSGCWYLSTATCLAGWPNHATHPAVLAYYRLELAWYLHMLLKPLFQYGLKDGQDIMIHHCASLALIVVSYATGLTRIGLLVLATFAISNPLLHIAKICNQLNLGVMKLGGFLLFALVFFLSRVLLVPWAVLKPAMMDSRRDVPHINEDFPALWWGVNALLALLYALQLLWMAGIVRVIRRAMRHGAEAASRLSAQLDPAKRYTPDSTAKQYATGSTASPAPAHVLPATPLAARCGADNSDSGSAHRQGHSPPHTPAAAVDSGAAKLSLRAAGKLHQL